MQGIQLYLVVGAAIASALVGGVFYAFSSFVMAALQRLEPKDGMTAMQAINTTAVEPGLMVPFLGPRWPTSRWLSRQSAIGKTASQPGCWLGR